MLNQSYSYYIFNVLTAGLSSILGLIVAAFLLAAIFFFIKNRDAALGGIRITWVFVIFAFITSVFAFYNGVYEFEEDPASVAGTILPAGEPDCGTEWTGWLKGGYGIGNPCPQGCYRGLTVRKQLSMSGFPPWPKYRREMQCWSYDQ